MSLSNVHRHLKMSNALLLLAVLGLSVTTTQALALEQRAPSDANVQCFTTMGSKSILQKDVPTHLETVRLTVTHTEFSHVLPVATIDLKDQITTKTVAAEGKTVPIDFVTPQAVTKTVTTTKTITTQSTSTSTIATSPGFKPVRSTLPRPTPPANPDARVRAKDVSLSNSPPKFAQEVECLSHTTTTITTTVVTTHDPSSTTTVYGATVATTLPKAAIAATTTKTVTKTITTTNVIPGPTIYASCLKDNMYVFPNQTFTYFEATGSYYYNVLSSTINSAYDCCVACLTRFHCVTGQFSPDPEEKYNQCQIYANKVASPQINTNLTAVYGELFGEQPTNDPIFNGDCGEYTSSSYDS